MPERIGDTSVLTTVHLVLIVALALLAVAVLVWGARLKRQRREAEKAAEEKSELAPPADTPLARPEAAREPEASAGLEGDVPAASAPAVTAAEPTGSTTPASPAPTGSVAANTADLAPEPLADEPIAAATIEANPAAEAASASAAPPIDAPPVDMPSVDAPATGTPTRDVPAPDTAAADGPITQLKGLGPKLAGRLNGLGITTVGDLARLSDAEAEALDARLGPFTGRMARDRWLEQARFLAAGDRAGFEAVFGRL